MNKEGQTMQSNQYTERRHRSTSPIAKQIIWTGSVALALILGITFLIVRPHYVKIQNKILSQKEQLQRDMSVMKKNNRKTVATLKTKNKELQKSVAGLQATQKQQNRRIHQLNREIETLNAQIVLLENDQKNLKIVQKNLEAEKSKLKEELSKAEEEKLVLDAELKQLRSASSQVIMHEKMESASTESPETNQIAGTQIVLHYTKEEEAKARLIQERLIKSGADVQLKVHQTFDVKDHRKTICYYGGSQATKAAEQMKVLLADIEPMQVVQSKVWLFWIDMDKINCWL
jgi:uncharacterized glyoxalase superfamily protein PhnB